MTPAVEARDVFRVYRSQDGEAAALQGLSMAIEDGEILAVLGPSGSGKSTLLRLLAGLERPSAGQVQVFGTDVSRLSGRAAAAYRATTLGYMEQHYWRSLDPNLCARDLVGLQLALGGVAKRERATRADALLEQVGLGGRSDARTAELSGGEQQRVALCAALAHRPRLLLADEPTGELDAASAHSVYELLATLARREGCVTLLVSHDPAVSEIADRTIHIRDGRVSEEALGREGGGAARIVVGRGGWLRLPEELLERAGIRTRASVRSEQGRVVLSSVPEERGEPREAPSRSPRAGTPRGRGTAAELVAVTKTFGSGPREVTIVDQLSSSFELGTVTAVTGPSGSGKTTLLHLLAGLSLPTSGDVQVLGREISGLDRSERAAFRREHVAYVGQQSELVPFLTARENVELALALRRPGVGDAKRRSVESLSTTGLAHRLDHRVSRLSAGERQRVAIARALAIGCELLLADEPTARLDQANALAIGSLFTSLVEETGMAVVCATHDPLLAEQAALSLELGRETGAPGARRSTRGPSHA